MEVSLKTMITVIRRIYGPRHELNVVAEVDGYCYISDYNRNVRAEFTNIDHLIKWTIEKADSSELGLNP